MSDIIEGTFRDAYVRECDRSDRLADLARELYELARELHANADATGGLHYTPHPALVRYEQEVDNA